MSERKRIYVASSWRNLMQAAVVQVLRAAGHEAYDFKNPAANRHGFHWSEIDPAWKGWEPAIYRTALEHPVARDGFNSDFDAMKWADTGVLVLPCGRSAHLEAGYFVGVGKPLYIVMLEPQEPELMYRMATGICISIDELLDAVGLPEPVGGGGHAIAALGGVS